MTKAKAGDQNFGHRHLNILNRYSLCNNPCRSHRHLLVHGSRKDFSHLQYKRCHLLRPDPTRNRHSKHGSMYDLPLNDHRGSRLQRNKGCSDCGGTRQIDWQNHSKRPCGYLMFGEHQSIGVGFGSRSHIQSSLSSSYRSPAPFLHRYYCLHIFRQQSVLAGAVINNSQIHQFGSGSNHSHNRQEPAAICKTDDAHYHDEKQNNVHDCTHGC